MTEELGARNLTALLPAPTTLMVAGTDKTYTPYQAILDSTASMPTATVTKRDGEATHEVLAATDGADIIITVTHSGIMLVSNNPTASEFSA